jgi:hypothetical protein
MAFVICCRMSNVALLTGVSGTGPGLPHRTGDEKLRPPRTPARDTLGEKGAEGLWFERKSSLVKAIIGCGASAPSALRFLLLLLHSLMAFPTCASSNVSGARARAPKNKLQRGGGASTSKTV